MSKDNDDPDQRARVYGVIAPLILQFAKEHAGQMFHVEELRKFVLRNSFNIAPDSPGRILRELRLERKLDYVVLNRHQSLYQFRRVLKT